MSVVPMGDKDHDNRELGIISGVEFGLGDGHGEPMLSFSVNVFPCTGSLQCLIGDDIKKFLTHDYAGKDIWISNIRHLNGKPVVMNNEGGYSRVVGLWNVAG